mgnify:CR=1 FL=1
MVLKRPEHLLRRFYREYLQSIGEEEPATLDLDKIPTLVRNRPIEIQDVVLSKLHSAVLTTDPVSNLYVCGIGRGGRLGLGDENTRFTYTPIQGPLADKRIVQVALGQNHTMAIDDTGALWTWGSNAQHQLGYTLPEPAKKDEDPISTVPRQVFGPLKKEVIIGIAASSIHSVAHTGSSLYCWGKNVGQLALMDADSRSLEYQQTPRKVAASLFSSPIVMVTAIDKATTVLLQNHTVCVFTAYGYHIVKFPFASLDMVGNIKLSTRYQPGWNQISYITSGGETIAALSRRGDLFTMNLDHKVDTINTASSTTNPSKIKNAVTPPQCIWHARHDGVRSVGVGEHGSVIISTESGAVWRRIKRNKAKDTTTCASDYKQKDFKFQRVPCISKVSAVRASAFGTFAAIRKDSDIMKEQLNVGKQTLWEDVASFNCLNGFQASELKDPADEIRKFWENPSIEERIGSVAYEVLKSSTLERDLAKYINSWTYRNKPLDVAVCTSSSSDIKIPVHGWLLSARSPVLRSALFQFRKAGSYTHEAFSITNVNGQAIVCFQGLDLISLLNLILFAYEDKVIPAWNFTGLVRPLAYRYRQIRQEVMRLATRLGMNALESAARSQVDAKKTMDQDFRLAIKDDRYFADGDALIELDGAEVPVHSSFVCARCPWFEGLFHGRSGGMWLDSRRQSDTEKIRIDLKHAEPKAFQYVVRYLYSDCGSELFDDAVCDSFDDFLDLVMEVMSIANYLMLDRLSQICQKVMGRFVTVRNIAHLLNAISPCSVTEFKDVGLEYICLQLETMLENHLLDELDEDLLLELDEVVRNNQLAQSPFARSGRAEELLHETYPWLAEEILEERQIRIKEMAYKAHREEERRQSIAKGRCGSFEEASPVTPTPDRVRKPLRIDLTEPSSPSLRAKSSQGDLMFKMDEDTSPLSSPVLRPRKSVEASPALDQAPTSLGSSWKVTGKKIRLSLAPSPPASPTVAKSIPNSAGPDLAPSTPAKTGKPWGETVTPVSKLDLREILQSQAATTKQSALSAGLAAQKTQEVTPKHTPTKLSQKEKKRQQQAALAALQAAKSSPQQPQNPWSNDSLKPSPWKQISYGKPAQPAKPATAPAAEPVSGSPTVPKIVAPDAGPAAKPTTPLPRRTASPDTRFAGQPRSSPAATTRPGTSSTTPSRPSQSSVSSTTPIVPHSRVYIPRPSQSREPVLGLSLEDIISEQSRDKQIVREAVAKRSLQEIQQEQAFQEWWDAESRRVQAEEERRRLERERREKEREEQERRRGREGKRWGRGRGRGGGGNNNEGHGERDGNGNRNRNGNGNGNVNGNGNGNWNGNENENENGEGTQQRVKKLSLRGRREKSKGRGGGSGGARGAAAASGREMETVQVAAGARKGN